MSTEGIRRKRRLWPWFVGFVGVVAVAVVAVLFFNGTTVFAGDPAPTQSVSPKTPVVIGKDDTGSKITASGPAVPAKLKAEPAKQAITPPFHNYKAADKRWHVTSITPSGKLAQPVQITLPLDHAATSNDLVLVAVNHTHTANGWQYVGGTITPDKRHITFTVDQLSWFAPLWLDIKNMIGELKTQFFDGMTSNVFAEAKPPSCDNESGATSDDYRISSDHKDTIFWCFGIEGGKRVLKVVNHRKYPLMIKTSNMTTKVRGHADLDLSQFVNGGKDVMLNGGDEAIFVVNNLNHGDYAKLNTDLSKASLGLHALDVIVSVLAQIIFKVNPHAAGKASEFIQYFLDSKECVSALGDIGNLGNFFKQCFTWDLLKEAFNWQVALAAPIMTAFSVLNLGQAITGAIADSGNGRSKYSVTVSRPKPNPFESFTLPADDVGKDHWHVHGVEVFIHADGAGEENWAYGPCYFDSSLSDTVPMCTGYATVKYVANSDGSITGTFTKVWYETSDGSPLASDFKVDAAVGDTFRVSHQKDSHLLWVDYISGKIKAAREGGNQNLCDPYAAYRNTSQKYSLCGA